MFLCENDKFGFRYRESKACSVAPFMELVQTELKDVPSKVETSSLERDIQVIGEEAGL